MDDPDLFDEMADVVNPGVIEEAMQKAEGKELPLTLEDGTQIGIAKVREVDDGFEVEAIVDEEHKGVVNLEGTALSVSSVEARVVREQEVLDKETAELTNLFGLYSALKADRIAKTKEKTQRRAQNKRARKSRRGNR